MSFKTKFVLLFILATVLLISIETIYLSVQDKNSIDKRLFVRLVTLPDLAISNETHYVRHRSLSDTFSIFSNSPTLSENFPSTFVYNYSEIQKNLPSRIEVAKQDK